MISGPVVAPRSGERARQLVVLLHGYGADGEDLIGLAGPLGDVLPEALFTAPNAPHRCAQNPFGYEWFPIDFGAMGESAQIGVPQARQAVVDYLEDAWSQTGLTAGETFLIGFSQGAMMALHVGLSLPEAPLAIVAFSGALVPPGTLGPNPPPVCLVHGETDNVVDPDRSREALKTLRTAGIAASLHISRNVAHGISPDGLEVAAHFLADRLDSATD